MASYEFGTTERMIGQEWDLDLGVGEYPLDWKCIAWNVKTEAGWRCEHCDHPHDTPNGYMLGVHHLDGNPANCVYTNLVALCQRCHLRIQARYSPDQVWLLGRPTWAIIRGVGGLASHASGVSDGDCF